MAIKVVEGGVVIHVRLSPGASHNKIGDIVLDADGNSVIKISVTVVPEKGKANKALIKLLAKNWRLPKSSIEIISGETSRNKALKISGSGENLKRLIQGYLPDNSLA